MSLLKGKIARLSATGMSATALVAALVLPNTVMGQTITLHRCGNDASDPTCISSIQVANPIAAQLAEQTATNGDPSATSTQNNETTQKADQSNHATAVDLLGQAQKNNQEAGDQTNDLVNVQKVDSRATASADPPLELMSPLAMALPPPASPVSLVAVASPVADASEFCVRSKCTIAFGPIATVSPPSADVDALESTFCTLSRSLV
jgi:hypothetical protein